MPSVAAKAAASISLPNRKSMYGMASISTALKGGTCTMKGADRFCGGGPGGQAGEGT